MLDDVLSQNIAEMPARRPAGSAASTSFIAQPRFVHARRWQTDDGVTWDDRCGTRAGAPLDPRGRRVMHRTTIIGAEPPVAG